MAPAIVCKNLTKTYGEGTNAVHAINGINLSVDEGEIRLLMGPSGSGKTTLISIMSGILTPDQGQCLFGNVDLTHLNDKEKTHFRGKNIGFVFQAFNLIPMLTTEENICIPLLLNGASKAKAIERSKELLKELGMADKVGVYPNQLSGGQQQRIAIARALVHDPKFIVCDEPTSFLDHETGTKIMELLREMVRKKNVTLVVVTHDPRIVQFADHINYLEDGKLVK